MHVVDIQWNLIRTPRGQAKLCPYLITGVHIKLVNFRKNLELFKRNCPQYSGVRRTGFHCISREDIFKFERVLFASIVNTLADTSPVARKLNQGEPQGFSFDGTTLKGHCHNHFDPKYFVKNLV